MERRTCSPLLATILLALACLSVWQMIGCPGPPQSVYITSPAYTLLSSTNSTDLQFSTDTLPSWDFSTLINLDDFKFEIINHVCNDTPPFLLVLVHSAPNNREKRKTIRETWGEPRDNMKILFMLGSVNNTKTQQFIEKENKMHGDLVQGNFKDAYRNMTYKHVMVFKYVVYYCPQVKYILKTDDDVFVNMPTVMSFLNVALSAWGSRKLMLCTPFENPQVKRSYRSKWRVSFKEFPDKYYPTYCPGWAVIYSPDVVFRLYREAQRSEYFWIDDVHITGILAKRLDLVHTPLKDLILEPNQVDHIIKYNSTDSPGIFPFLYGSPNLKQDVIYKLWYVVRERMKYDRLAKAR